MNQTWGIVLIVFTLIGWLGQVISLISPRVAAGLGVSEPESDVDPVDWADIRGEALWDSLVLWTLPVSGILLILDNRLWISFGLVGGGMWLYFVGRAILTRVTLQRRGIRIGSPKTLAVNYAFIIIWGIIASVTIFKAAAALSIPK